MRQSAMVADGCSESTRACHDQGAKKYPPTRKRKQDDSHNGQDMDGHNINHDKKVLPVRFPPGQRPWVSFGESRSTHSGILLETERSKRLTWDHGGVGENLTDKT